MRRKWRSILATVIAVAIAIFSYVRGQPRPLDFAAMNFNFDDERGKLQDIPLSLRKMDGSEVCVEGYMMLMDASEPVHQFAVVPQLGWGDGSDLAVTQVVVASCRDGCTYCPDLICVSGTLHVRVDSDSGFVISVFELDAQRVCAVYTGRIARWPWFVIGGVPPLVSTALLRRWLINRKRQRARFCLKCNYDLRASPHRCPECGLVI